MINSEQDFKYSIQYNIEGNYSCESHGCNDEGICRCFSISDVEIYHVDIPSIAYSIYDDLFNQKSIEYKRDSNLSKILDGIDGETKKILDIYFIDRLLRINKIYKSDCWDTNYGSGYYGEELHSITLRKKEIDILNKKISEIFLYQTLKEKCEFILKEEYGYLLDSIKDKQFKVLDILVSDIEFSQKDYKSKIDTRGNYSDKEYDSIRAICLKDGEKWRVIDGYHRLTQTKLDKVKIIAVYENK